MTNSDNTTRRAFLSTAAVMAVAAAGAMPAIATAASADADPIFAAIHAHKVAADAFDAELKTRAALESELPNDKRQSSVTAHGSEIVPTDDARWIRSEQAVSRLGDIETDAACELVSVAPTTMAGVVAVLRYAIDASPTGERWPMDLQIDGGSNATRTWEQLLLANLADVLPGMVQA